MVTKMRMGTILTKMIKIHKNIYYLDDGGHSLKAPVPPLQPNTVGNLRGYPSRASALVLGSFRVGFPGGGGGGVPLGGGGVPRPATQREGVAGVGTPPTPPNMGEQGGWVPPPPRRWVNGP